MQTEQEVYEEELAEHNVLAAQARRLPTNIKFDVEPPALMPDGSYETNSDTEEWEMINLPTAQVLKQR